MPKRKKSLSGLNQRKNGIWYLDKKLEGCNRIHRSCETTDYKDAEQRALHWIKAAQDSKIFKTRTKITLNEAIEIYKSTQIKKSLPSDLDNLKK